jgi:hypothetical protein
LAGLSRQAIVFDYNTLITIFYTLVYLLVYGVVFYLFYSILKRIEKSLEEIKKILQAKSGSA